MTLLLHFLFNGVFDASQQLLGNRTSETAQSVDTVCLLLGCQAVHQGCERLIDDRKVVVLCGFHIAAVQHFIEYRQLIQLQCQLRILTQHWQKPVKGLIVSSSPQHSSPRRLVKDAGGMALSRNAIIGIVKERCDGFGVALLILPHQNRAALGGSIGVSQVENVEEAVVSPNVRDGDAMRTGANTPPEGMVPLVKRRSSGDVGILGIDKSLLPEAVLVQPGLCAQEPQISGRVGATSQPPTHKFR